MTKQNEKKPPNEDDGCLIGIAKILLALIMILAGLFGLFLTACGLMFPNDRESGTVLAAGIGIFIGIFITWLLVFKKK